LFAVIHLESVCLLVPLGQIYKIMQTIYESVLSENNDG
ncbi:hypothetical protein FHS57_003982, partial [Runella defluvii]|nr:hypothetical protein [Runella defluvii]